MEYGSHEEIIHQLSSIYSNAEFILTYKDLSHEFLYCNNFMLDYIGAKSQKETARKTDFDFRWEPFADLYLKHEQDTLKRNIYVALVPVCDAHGVVGVASVHRMPCFNRQNEVVGILTHTYLLKNKISLELSNLVVKNTSQDNAESFYTVNKKNAVLNLSPREQECLFYFIRGKTCKVIAQILGISFRTVEAHIENIKQKFGCYNKYELIDVAIAQGYLYDIPISLLKEKIVTDF